MANPKIKFKRSAVEGKRPDINSMELGELAVNTYEGRLFVKRDTSGAAGIETGNKLVNPWIENNANTGIACTYQVNVSGLTTFTENVHLLDNDKLIFGTGEDLEIYHDGSHSYISDQGQGNLKVLSNNIRFTNADESKTSVTFVPSGSVDLYYNNDLRFSTTGVGVTIWGETETRTLNVSGVSTFGSNIVSSGIITATQFVGDGSGLSNIVGTGTGVYIQVNNTQIGAATTLNFAGNLSASVSGGVASVTVPTTSIVRQSFTATSNQTSFTVAGGYTSGYIDIHLNGVKLNVGTDVTANDESNIVLSVGASVGDVIETTVFKTLQISPDTNIRKEVVNITEVTPTIDVASGYNVGHLDVYLNGLKLIDGTDFTATNGTSVSLTTSAVDGDTVEFVAVRTLNSIPGAGIGTDGSVNTVGVITASSFVGPLTGNADTATRLAGTRTISGVSFNGSSNITLDNSGITNNRGYITNVVSGILTAATFSGNLPTTDLTGTITNAQLSGSIANSKLVNDSVSFGGVSLDLGQSDTTPAFDLSDATNYPYDSLTGITTSIIGDTTPQLGGNLDVNNNNITGTGNVNLTGIITTTTFSGNLTGDVTGNLTGNSSTATTLETARNIAIVGDVTGTTSFNGSGDVSITATVVDDSHNHVIGNVDGLQTALDLKAPISSPGLTGTPTAPTAAAGTNTTQVATTAYVSTAVANIVDNAPAALDTLNELAAALGDDASFSTTVTTSIGTKLPKSGGEMTGNITFSGSQTVDGRDLSADGTKLDGIESGATADQSAAEILTAIKTVDGSGSGLDADTLDGIQSSNFLKSNENDTFEGDTLTFSSNASDPVILIKGTGPNFITFASDGSGTVDSDSINLVYRASPNQLGFERASDGTTLFSLDADTARATFGENIVVAGTVDGRDLAVDGTKLDGIEAGATGDQTAAEIRTLVESATDSNVFTDADHSKLNGIASGATNVTNNNQLTNGAGYITATLTNEQVQDIVGGMVTGNTESGITVTYKDADGTIDFSVASQTDQNFTNADHTKLDGIESNATADQTAAEIRTLVGSASDSNVFTDADHSKLNGIESGATADQSAAEILTAIKTVDGSGSGLDADLLDGIGSGSFLRSDADDTMTGALTIDVDNKANGALRINANQTTPVNDFYFAQEIISTLSGSTTFTGDKEQGGIYMDINSTATGGGTSHEHRAYGMYIDLDSTGDADNVIGVHANATATPTTGTSTDVVGGYFYAEDNGGAGNVTNVTGVRGYAVSDNSSSDTNNLYGGFFKAYNIADTGDIGGATAVYGEIEIPNGTGDHYGNSYVFRAEYDDNDGVAQTNTTYLYYGNYSGTLPTTAYGIYINSDVDNYFAGNVTSNKVVQGNTLKSTVATGTAPLLVTSTTLVSNLNADLLDGQQGSYYTGYTDTAIANLIDSAPATLDTLNELAAALGDDANFSTTITNSIAAKLPLAGGQMTGDIDLNGNKLIEVEDIGLRHRIFHDGDTNCYIEFHANDQWRVVTGNNERLEVNNTQTTINQDATVNGELTIGGSSVSTTEGGEIRLTKPTNQTTGDTYIDLNSSKLRFFHSTSPNKGAYINLSNCADAVGSRILTTSDEGSGNGLDADTVDGIQGASFLRSDANDTATGSITFSADTNISNQKYIGYNASYNYKPRITGGIGTRSEVISAANLLLHADTDGSGTAEFLSIRAGGGTANELKIASKTVAAGQSSSALTYNGGQVWHAGNDGAGSGLDSDLLDGQQGSYYLNYNNLSNVPTITFDSLSGKTSGTGDYSTTGDIVSGRGSGGVALTINDGKGNANVTFNHQNGVPEQNGNAARIEVNTDSTSGASMYFELKSNVTANSNIQTSTILTLTESAATVNGDVSATNFNSTSDIKLKENIKVVEDPISILNQIDGVKFTWKETEEPSVGVIAQDVEKVLPELISERDDEIKTVNYNGLVGVLIEAVKEQQKQINDLKNEIKSMKG